jgi:hypothetical protein
LNGLGLVAGGRERRDKMELVGHIGLYRYSG